MDYRQRKAWVYAYGDLVAIVQIRHTLHRPTANAKSGKIHSGIQQVAVSIFMGINRNTQCLPQLVDSTGVVEVAVGQQDRLDDPAFTPYDVQQLIRLRAGVDQESVSGNIVDIEKAVFFKIALHGHTAYHSLIGVCSLPARSSCPVLSVLLLP